MLDNTAGQVPFHLLLRQIDNLDSPVLGGRRIIGELQLLLPVADSNQTVLIEIENPYQEVTDRLSALL